MITICTCGHRRRKHYTEVSEDPHRKGKTMDWDLWCEEKDCKCKKFQRDWGYSKV